VHEERVVVGQIGTQTPLFSKDLETIYFHPRWNVPPSIKVNEVLPSLARGGGYFHRQGMKLVRNGREVNPRTVNWGKSDIRNYDVYQPSGPGNALGLMKFTFPNKHAVYMHDTQSKGLFSSTQRTFSHGCVRVKNPLVLAQVLLNIDKGWSADEVAALLEGEPEENAVPLYKHIPVHLTYFTAQVDDDGEVTTTADVYGHEKRITQAMQGKWKDIDKGADHLAQIEIAKRLDDAATSRRSRRTASSGRRPVARSYGAGGGGGYSTRVSSSGSSANDVFRRSFGY
jgi:murein L,D-transpeptidase YcbB/YkuD